jgi:hypothetical protein
MRPKGVFAQNCPLGLIIQLQMHPVDGVITLSFLRLLDELSTKSGSGCLRWSIDCFFDLGVIADSLDHATILHSVENAAVPIDVVVLKI